MKEIEIVNTAIENLDPTLIKGTWASYEKSNGTADGVLELCFDGQTVKFDAIIKNEIRSYMIDQLIDMARTQKNPMVITKNIFPVLKEKLKEHRINYLEANGNLFVNAGNLLLFLDTNRKIDRPDNTGNRAFTPAGLKVVFELLRDKALINRPQRDIADRAGVALGNIPKVIQGLQDADYMFKLNRKEYAFRNREELLHKWTDEYQNTLKPKLRMGAFTLKPADFDWKQVNFTTHDTVWGGEPAGDILTNHLRPEILTVYTRETKKDLMMNYGFIPDNTGKINIYEKFWIGKEEERTAPPILVYVDLINTQEKRCLETAKKLYDEQIKPEL